MKSALEAIRARALERLQNAEDLTALEEARVQLLGKKGELTAILKTMGQLSPEERPVMGQMANEVRAAIEEKLAARGAALKAAMAEQKLKMETIDVTLPGKPVREGHRHPLNLVLDEIKESLWYRTQIMLVWIKVWSCILVVGLYTSFQCFCACQVFPTDKFTHHFTTFFV